MSALKPTNRLADDLFTLTSLLRPAHTKNGGAARDLPLEVWESDDAYTVLAEAPGLEAEAIDITFHGGLLTLEGERTRPEMDGMRRLGGLAYGPFEQSVRFGAAVASDKILAESKNGVLTVRVPKADEAKPRKIEIKSK